MARKKIIERKPKVLPKPIVKRTRKPKKAEKLAEVSIHKTKIPITGTTTTTSAPTPPINIKYDGAEVVSILTKGETAYHCQMSNGTTAWVPKSLFAEKTKE